MKKIAFGLGSNLGDRQKNIENAIKELTKIFDLQDVKQSRIFENKAMLLPDSPKEWDINFYNIALVAKIDETKFSPLKILKEIKNIETKLGRKKSPKWSPREIDIDILIIQDTKFKNNELEIPHYDLKNREFFVKTLDEVWKNWRLEIK